MGNNKCFEVVIKDYFDKSSTLQSSVQEVKIPQPNLVGFIRGRQNEVVAVQSHFSDLEYFGS
jgi:aspartate kinase